MASIIVQSCAAGAQCGPYFLPPPLFLLSVEVPVPPPAACCAFLAAFSSSAFLSLPAKIPQTGSERRGSEPTDRDSAVSETDRVKQNVRGGWNQIDDTHLSRRCSGVSPSWDPLALGFRAAARSRSRSLWLPRARRVKEEATEQERNRNNNRSSNQT
uniref:Uncharacterized protein n=1 Tax=Setaria italica TaxID=4555 RepID=K3Y1P1_SETIT